MSDDDTNKTEARHGAPSPESVGTESLEKFDIFGNAGGDGGKIDTVGQPGEGISQVDETDRLRFAREVLFALFFFVILIVTMAFIQPENKALDKIFDWAKIGVLPLVTLVIGFYFPNSNRSK